MFRKGTERNRRFTVRRLDAQSYDVFAFRASLLIAALAIAGACARPSFDVAAARRDLLRRDAEWADAAAADKDLDKIVSYWSDDALVIEPGQPVYEGKAAIRAYVAASLRTPGFKIHWISEKPVFSPDGKMAWMRGTDEMTVPGPAGELVTLHNRGISIWRREPDGLWRCVVDIGNEPPTAAKSIHDKNTGEGS